MCKLNYFPSKLGMYYVFSKSYLKILARLHLLFIVQVIRNARKLNINEET